MTGTGRGGEDCPMSHRPRLPAIFLVALFALSCHAPKKAQPLRREDLFDIAYGTAETELDFSSPVSENFDVCMREGIFMLLDPGAKKVLKLTSYGDLLSLFYDPRSVDSPKALASGGPEEGAAGPGGARRERAAYATKFVEPSRIAMDSGQRLYVVDRLENSAGRVFDIGSGAYCDRVVRRLDASGVESAYLGQEGIRGTPFPFVLSLAVLGDDSLVVVSASESVYLVHRFSSSGELISSIRISRSALPLPKALEPGKEGPAVYANLDALVPELGAEGFGLLLKIDYYRDVASKGGGPGGGTAYAGSWIFGVDGGTGGYGSVLDLSPSGEAESIPELLGVWGGRYILIDRLDEGSAGEKKKAEQGWILKSVEKSGRVDGRYSLDMPQGVLELSALRLSASGQVFGLAKREKDVAAFWWRLER